MSKIVFHLNCLELGGAERVVTNLSAQFAQDGYEVIIATEWQGEQEYSVYEKVRRIHVGLSQKDESNSRISKYIKRIKYLRKMLQEEKPDIVVAFAKKANYRALMAAKGTNIPVIIAVRIDPIGNYEERFDKILINHLFKRAEGAVFQTPQQRDFFEKSIKERNRVILNPIHDKYIGREPIKERTKEIMHVGRLVDFKNQQLLIRAFSEVHKKYPEYILKLFGGDSFDGTKELLEKTIGECGMEKEVLIMGASEDIPNDIEKGTFFIATSDYEGLPNAVMEAMALGLPTISTDCPCGGPSSIIQSGENGLLIPIKNQRAAEDAMVYMIENKDKAEKMGKNAKKLGEMANSQAIYQQWKEYVESLIKK